MGVGIPPGMSASSRTSTAGADLLSVDVEDYFQVEAFADRIPIATWPDYTRRVVRNVWRLLELLAGYEQRGTFFVLGWVADQEPQLIRDIFCAGHEIACHSYAHRRIFTMSPEEFRDDLRQARDAVRRATGVEVVGYRAPSFSITRRSLWALDILAEEGFTYDSSIFPIRHDLYGMAEAPRFPHRRVLEAGHGIIEIPPSTVSVLGTNLPVAGGGYLRHLPMQFHQWAIQQIHRENQPAIVYLHPWEIDPDQPRLPGRWKSRFRHYRGLKHMETCLTELLARYRFQPFIDYVRAHDAERTGRTAVAAST